MWVPFLRSFPGNDAHVSTSDFQSEVGEVFGEIGGELPAKFGRRFSSFFCWGKSSEAFSTKTPLQISPSNFTTRFWVVAGPTHKLFSGGPKPEEDKRATTNVQNGLVFFFVSFYSLLLNILFELKQQ